MTKIPKPALMIDVFSHSELFTDVMYDELEKLWDAEKLPLPIACYDITMELEDFMDPEPPANYKTDYPHLLAMLARIFPDRATFDFNAPPIILRCNWEIWS